MYRPAPRRPDYQMAATAAVMLAINLSLAAYVCWAMVQMGMAPAAAGVAVGAMFWRNVSTAAAALRRYLCPSRY